MATEYVCGKAEGKRKGEEDTRFDTFGTTVLEAMAASLPVIIISNVGGQTSGQGRKKWIRN